MFSKNILERIEGVKEMLMHTKELGGKIKSTHSKAK